MSDLDLEREFHDAWGETVDVGLVPVTAAIEGPTAPEPRYIMQFFGDVSSKRVLDVGCGAGEAAVYLAMKGADVTALDISPGMLRATEALAEHHQVADRVKTVCSPAEKIPLPDASFDLIYGRDVLHHVDLAAVSAQVGRLMVPGGRAAFIEPIAYNPAINIYRRMAEDVHTPGEHPLTRHDIAALKKVFPTLEHREFQLLTLAIFVWMWAVERLDPATVRYWKRLIDEHERYGNAFRRLESIDRVVLRIVPPLRWWCWNTVVTWRKPES